MGTVASKDSTDGGSTPSALAWALIIFAGFGLEVALVVVEQALGFRMVVGQASGILHHSWTMLLWLGIAWIAMKPARQLGIFARGQVIPASGWLLASALIVGLVAYTTFFAYDGRLKIVHEWTRLGVLPGLFQHLYYLVEMWLATLLIGFGQAWGEKRFHAAKVPFGGVVLALTWGLVHFLTQDPTTGVFAMIAAVVFGEVFVLVKKHPLYAWLLLSLGFVV